MKKHLTPASGRTLAGMLLGALVISAATAPAAIPGRIVKTNGQVVAGDSIKWRGSMQQYVVSRADGVSLNVDKADVSRVIVDEPPTLKAAIASVQRGQPGAARSALQQIVTDYAMLMHDITAARYLGEVELKSNNAAGAVTALQQVVDNYGFGMLPGELINVYLDALADAGQKTKVKAILSRMIAEGSRGAAAVALVKRGDLLREEGQYKQALLDGYLRTVVLFQDEKAVRPQALYYAAKCFQELNQLSYADKMNKQLMAEFPRNSYTQKAQAGK